MPVKNSPPEHQIDWGPSPSVEEILPSPSPIPVDFSPPLIAMVVIVATAFFIVTYFRLISRHLLPPILLLFQRSRHRWTQWRHHHYRRRQSFIPSLTDIESPPSLPHPLFDSAFHFLGLEDEAIRTIPLSVYTKKRKSFQDCAVCLLEFEQNDYVRTLPICSHAFHVDCIDIWLRSHANCPLCRAGIFLATDSPFIPLMANRVRPSLEEGILQSIPLERTESEEEITELRSSLDEIISPRQNNNNNNDNDQQEERQDFFLKRSYSFGFERNLPADRIVLEAATATPWRYRRGSGFWNKHQNRQSPFMARPRVFSFRYMKSPFFRQRRGERSRFFPLSESNARFSGGGGGGGGSSRRSKSMTSPMFLRSSLTTANMAMFSSSRMRCGDLDALLSPERFNRR